MKAVAIAMLVAECAALVLPQQSFRASLRSGPVCASDVSVTVKPGAGGGNDGPSEEQLAEVRAMQREQLSNQVAAMLSEFPKTLMPGVAPPARPPEAVLQPRGGAAPAHRAGRIPQDVLIRRH